VDTNESAIPVDTDDPVETNAPDTPVGAPEAIESAVDAPSVPVQVEIVEPDTHGALELTVDAPGALESTVNAFEAVPVESDGFEAPVDAFTADCQRFYSSSTSASTSTSTLASTLASTGTSTSASLTTDNPGKSTHEVNSLYKVNSLHEVNGLHEHTAIGRGGVG